MITNVRLVLFAGVFLAILHTISAFSEDSWKRGPEMESVIIESPHLSRGLTPVVLKKTAEKSGLIIAREGKALVPLVIPNSQGRYYRDVASFLKLYLDEACGTDFKIVTADMNSETGIYIGPCERANLKELINRSTKLPPENFVISRIESGIALIGRDK